MLLFLFNKWFIRESMDMQPFLKALSALLFLLIFTQYAYAVKETPLTPIRGIGWNVSGDYQITPDSTHVVYRGRSNGNIDLYSVPIDGGDEIKLNAPLTIGNVSNFFISPNSDYVIYLADDIPSNSRELFKAPLRGGSTTKISDFNSTTTPNYRVSSNGDQLVYIRSNEVYSYSHLGGGQAVKLPITIENSDCVNPGLYTITHNGSHVIINITEINNSCVGRLIVASTSGGEPLIINESGTIRSADVFRTPMFTADNQYFIYSVCQNNEDDIATQQYPCDLFRIRLNNLTSTALTSSGRVDHKDIISISTTDNTISYGLVNDLTNKLEIFNVDIDGTQNSIVATSSTLEGKVVGKFTTYNPRIRYLPETQKIIYLGQSPDQKNGVWDIFSASFDGGETQKLTHTIVGNAGVTSLGVSADESTIAYTAKDYPSEFSQLYKVNISGLPTNRLISAKLAPFNFQQDIHITPDGDRIFFRADASSDYNEFELYASQLGNNEIPIKLNGKLTLVGSVEAVKMSSDGQFIVYRADQNVVGIQQLFSINTNDLKTDPNEEICLPVTPFNLVCL